MNHVLIKPAPIKESLFETNETVHFSSYFNFLSISVQSYGQLFILIAFLLSAFSWVCLKTVQRQRIGLLQTIQKQAEDLTQKNVQLYAEYENHFMTHQIQKSMKIQGLKVAKLQHIVPIATWSGTHQSEY